VKLDLGCGAKKINGFTGIDCGDFKSIYPEDEFILGDVFEVISDIESDTIEAIYSNQFIEHIPKDKFIGFLNQCYRILKLGGIFEATFPPAITSDGKPNGQFYADPLHVNAILPGTFCCFSGKYRKEVYEQDKTDYTGYGIQTDFNIIESQYINTAQVYIKLVKE
jgi:hypothetical protein